MKEFYPVEEAGILAQRETMSTVKKLNEENYDEQFSQRQ
jgi:hypothetical protein